MANKITIIELYKLKNLKSLEMPSKRYIPPQK